MRPVHPNRRRSTDEIHACKLPWRIPFRRRCSFPQLPRLFKPLFHIRTGDDPIPISLPAPPSQGRDAAYFLRPPYLNKYGQGNNIMGRTPSITCQWYSYPIRVIFNFTKIFRDIFGISDLKSDIGFTFITGDAHFNMWLHHIMIEIIDRQWAFVITDWTVDLQHFHIRNLQLPYSCGKYIVSVSRKM